MFARTAVFQVVTFGVATIAAYVSHRQSQSQLKAAMEEKKKAYEESRKEAEEIFEEDRIKTLRELDDVRAAEGAIRFKADQTDLKFRLESDSVHHKSEKLMSDIREAGIKFDKKYRKFQRMKRVFAQVRILQARTS